LALELERHDRGGAVRCHEAERSEQVQEAQEQVPVHRFALLDGRAHVVHDAMSPRSLLQTDAAPGSTSGTPALLAKGFRPFFLLAAGLAVIALPAWLWMFATNADAASYLGPMYWHAHEMVFGFAVAVIAGFLLTATSNWTS